MTAHIKLTSISGISEKDRVEIASKKEAATKLLQQKKSRGESGKVKYAKHKKQKSKHRGLMPTPEKLEKRNIVEVEEAKQADSSKRQKSEGQDGYKQLGCSAHDGMS